MNRLVDLQVHTLSAKPMKLKITSPDIATLFCLSERVIENYRYRIRTKLGLTRKENLAEALAKL